ncbi:amino acid/amide ABC transporter ATP-binding protein 2, HAAT family [Tistlia consotensis]|uniref:Amino acid/amide ABC transporter ATP-binding protein 2, HAAT family n=1 Tax=Tistlia consotensis USBA 355 TaxID=560819 RepID=A0A1Y6CH97_9PROT|nr:ABC transporter ATP-binding protein [Tistlia consotensis]SMF55761.1 amino acid/amide ABC transporter ATP-binding protein 2, HAAT family [Tistlia consotensis USBA 355]SNR89202.1 amino acid/amide ABC transporter ATP-binding protein 2, HAAT family [Tistlia consotensis]
MSALLTLERVSAGYGHQQVIRDLSLALGEGQLAALIGPNGHGKTTLLRTISGLLHPSGGTIALEGRRLDRLRPDQIVEAGIIHVPQGDLLFPEMTVLENLRMGAYLPEAAREEARRLEEVFALFPKLRDRQGQLAGTLSGGERRMVGIGRGLMAGGRLLMLDEPSLGLAPIVIDQIYEAIATLRASGRSVLIVEENAMRIAELADVLHLLDNGSFAWSGSGAELLSRPESLAAYLGA